MAIPHIPNKVVNDMNDVIHIDRYISEIENKTIKYYAIAGKKRYPMPDCYSDMYTDDYLAITKKTMKMPELYNAPAEHYIPLRTAP